MNAYTHGGCSANAKAAQRYIQECRQLLNDEEKLHKLYRYVEDCLHGGETSPNGAVYPEGAVKAIAELNTLQGHYPAEEVEAPVMLVDI